MVTVTDVSKTFYHASKRIEVLKNINFSLNKSHTMSVVGPSGCGKTTLLSLLAGLDLPNSGKVMIDQKNIIQMDEQQRTQFRSQNISIVFQQFHLMPYLSALENVTLPLEISKSDHIEKRAKEQLDKVGLSHRYHHLPHELSGGEQQRVAIARACITQPKLLLADEPSGNLDKKSARQILDLLFSLVDQNQTTLIVVTHNEEVAQRCQYQMNLNKND